MKKSVYGLAVVSLMALSLAGCGKKEAASADPGTAAEASQAPETEEKTEAEQTEDTKEESKGSGEDGEKASSEAEGGTLIVGFDQDFPPMGFIGDDGEYTGFDLELAQEAAKRLGLEYKPQPIAWDSKDMELDRKSTRLNSSHKRLSRMPSSA